MDTAALDLWSHTLAEYELTPPRGEHSAAIPSALGSSPAQRARVTDARQPTRDNWPAAATPSARDRGRDAFACNGIDEAAGHVLDVLNNPESITADDPRRPLVEHAHAVLEALLPLLAPDCVGAVVVEEES